MNCLVLGGSGFIGSNLCMRLINEGHNVLNYDRIDIFNSVFDNNQYKFIKGEFSTNTVYDEVMKNIDIVFHLISTTLPSSSNKDRIYDINSNVISTLNMLDQAVKHHVNKVYFFSSGGTVYGRPEIIPIPEEHPTNPICSYGIQKLTIEKYLHLYYELFGLDYMIIRLANPYGPGQSGNNGQGVIPVFMRKIINNEPIEIWGDGSVVRDYIYIDDVMNAIIKMMKYNGKVKMFNIGSGVGHNLIEVINEISYNLEKKYTVNFSISRGIDVSINVLNIDKSKEEISWEPYVYLSKGVSLLVDVKIKEAAVSNI